MKTDKINSTDLPDQKLIEDHVYLEIEDKGPVASERIAAVAETEPDPVETVAPVKKRSYAGWWAAAIVALLAIGCCIFFATRDSENRKKQVDRMAQTVGKTAGTVKSGFYSAAGAVKDGVSAIGEKAGNIAQSAADKVADAVSPEDVTVFGKYPMASGTQVDQAAAKGKTVDYLYYFANAESSVGENAVLNEVAEKARATDADITITAYASPTGSAAYNANLCEQRAENLENYLIAHGVGADHVKIVNGGQTSRFGSDAYCRRADIVVNYAG